MENRHNNIAYCHALNSLKIFDYAKKIQSRVHTFRLNFVSSIHSIQRTHEISMSNIQMCYTHETVRPTEIVRR